MALSERGPVQEAKITEKRLRAAAVLATIQTTELQDHRAVTTCYVDCVTPPPRARNQTYLMR